MYNIFLKAVMVANLKCLTYEPPFFIMYIQLFNTQL